MNRRNFLKASVSSTVALTVPVLAIKADSSPLIETAQKLKHSCGHKGDPGGVRCFKYLTCTGYKMYPGMLKERLLTEAYATEKLVKR